jgi:hypothetical protein
MSIEAIGKPAFYQAFCASDREKEDIIFDACATTIGHHARISHLKIGGHAALCPPYPTKRDLARRRHYA